MAFRSSTRAAGLKLGGGIVTAGSAFTFTGIVDGTKDAGSAVAGNPIGGIGVLVGLAIIAYGYRDDLASAVGLFRPNALYRKLNDWFDADGYTKTVKAKPPTFILEVHDTNGHGPFQVALRPIHPEGIEIIGGVQFHPNDQQLVSKAPRAEWREMQIRLAIATMPLDDVSLLIEHMFDAQRFIVKFAVIMPVAEINELSVFEAIQSVRKSVGASSLVLFDFVQRLKGD
jgi:hypothetical protein